MILTIKPKIAFKKLTIFICILLVLNFLDIYLRIYKGYDYQIVTMLSHFNFDNEESIPTMYSALALFLTGIILYIISLNKKHSKTNSYMWLGLSMIFIFLSADELLRIHEKIGGIFQTNLDTSGMLWFAWVIPYSVLVLLVAVIYSKFLFNLKKKIRVLFILSGFIFVLGAAGLELIESQIYYENNGRNLLYYILSSVEEFMEMFGIILFIYTLLYYIETEIEEFKIKI